METAQVRGSVTRILEQGKSLPFGTRLVYTGPSLKDEEYRLLESLKGTHFSLEYAALSDKKLPLRKRHYQIKEMGYEII